MGLQDPKRSWYHESALPMSLPSLLIHIAICMLTSSYLRISTTWGNPQAFLLTHLLCISLCVADDGMLSEVISYQDIPANQIVPW